MITEQRTCYVQQGKEKSLMLAQAIGGGVQTAPDVLFPGTTPVFVGVHPTTIHLLRQAHLQEKPFVTVDNGYFSPYKSGGYFRATTNGLQWTRGLDSAIDCTDAKARWEHHGQKIKPWRKDGEHILLVLQTPQWYANFGLDRTRWAEEVADRLAKVTDRRIRIREKPLKGISNPPPPLEQDFENCWAVVALSSNVLVQALMTGIPAVAMAPCAASPLATPLEMIETPVRGEREPLAWGLSANQWTVEEMASGRMWAELKARYSPTQAPLAG